ncbi:MAG: glycine cleavage system aminomethyltransferase GcvT [Caulobacterales bacterium]|nr:glycine cleavage system aminomethyltransferase GcvT [Caulobacterales bacterium]
MSEQADRLTTPLHDLHLAEGGRMVAFAGYDMPVQYRLGVMKEHLHARAAAGLFDVSHMGQVAVRPRSGDVADAARAMERLTPADMLSLKPWRQRYGLLTDEGGGILDDLMVANFADHLFMVVNAACKAGDIAHLKAHLEPDCAVEPLEDRALLALQGPKAEEALADFVPDVAEMAFMDVLSVEKFGGRLFISRSGYTGEDGFEISVPATRAGAFARALLASDQVELVGLGARDSLRLEAGLCLYGSDIDTTTSPVEAALSWSIGKARRAGGDRAGGFPGAERILGELEGGAARKRVGLKPEGRAPMRAGTALFAGEAGGDPVGTITSGGYGPSLEAPIAMGYVASAQAAAGTRLYAEVRGKRLPAVIADPPFVTPRYKRR